MQSLDQLLAAASHDIAEATTLEDLDAVDSALLGRGSLIAQARRGLGSDIANRRPFLHALHTQREYTVFKVYVHPAG